MFRGQTLTENRNNSLNVPYHLAPVAPEHVGMLLYPSNPCCSLRNSASHTLEVTISGLFPGWVRPLADG